MHCSDLILFDMLVCAPALTQGEVKSSIKPRRAHFRAQAPSRTTAFDASEHVWRRFCKNPNLDLGVCKPQAPPLQSKLHLILTKFAVRLWRQTCKVPKQGDIINRRTTLSIATKP